MLLLFILGCGDPSRSSDTGCSPVDLARDGLTWDGWLAGFMTTYCLACHSADSPDRRGAPEGVDFDTLEDVLLWSQPIRLRVLEEQTMPVGGGILPDELQRLEDFLDCSESS